MVDSNLEIVGGAGNDGGSNPRFCSALDEELLVILGEECSEIIKEVSKSYRFGLDTEHPTLGTPRSRLVLELGGLLAVMNLLVARGVVDHDAALVEARRKTPHILKNLRNTWESAASS